MGMLDLVHVSKSFGSNQVLKDLSFSVKEHSIYGFIGRNGAGKTTTLKMILGLLRPDGGEISVGGKPVRFGGADPQRPIGYLPDVPEFYDFMTPGEYLELCGKAAGLAGREAAQRIPELLERVGLAGVDKRIGGFSRGMKQRLGIAQALLNDPVLLICDEPTSALDPLGRKEILEIFLELKEHTTILFSTHILADVERICDETAFLCGGRIVLEGAVEEVKRRGRGGGFEVEVCSLKDARLLEERFPFCRSRNGTKLYFEEQTKEEMMQVMQELAAQKIPIERIERLERTLEDLFMEVLDGEN